MLNSANLHSIEIKFQALFKQLEHLQSEIHKGLLIYADGKNLKGNDLVGWLGEIYGKLLLNGKLVNESEEHDLVTPEGWLVSVKTRKGSKLGWQRSSAIPKIEGHGCPTHLLFVHLSDDYLAEHVWLFSWPELLAENRFKQHKVRGVHRSYIFSVDYNKDRMKLIYHRQSEQPTNPATSAG